MGDYRGEPRGYYEDMYYGGRGYGGHSYGGPNHQRNGPNYQEHQMTMSGGVPTVQFELIYFKTRVLSFVISSIQFKLFYLASTVLENV